MKGERGALETNALEGARVIGPWLALVESASTLEMICFPRASFGGARSQSLGFEMESQLRSD